MGGNDFTFIKELGKNSLGLFCVQKIKQPLEISGCFFMDRGAFLNKIKFHVLSLIVLNITLMIVVFSTDQPLILLSSLILALSILIVKNRKKNIDLGLKIFLPIAVVTSIVNFLLVDAGTHVIFRLFNRSFTLETVVYALIMSLKILVVIYLFYCLDCTIDSDEAVSYFSRKAPKVTLILLLCIKLVPNMKKRIRTLNDVYVTRGVNFTGESKREKIKANIPVMSILLSDSLDNAFDIGESAYVRGFLSSNRTQYDKKRFHFIDFAVIVYSCILLVFHVVNIVKGTIIYDSYDLFNKIISFDASAESIMILLVIIIFLNKTFKGDEDNVNC